jgi:hypothetical protein
MSDAPEIIPTCEIIDSDWDALEVRDLVQTTPLCFDDDGVAVGYQAEQLFGLEAADLLRRSL